MEKFGEIAIRKGLIDENVLKSELKKQTEMEQWEKIGFILCFKRYIENDQLEEILEIQELQEELEFRYIFDKKLGSGGMGVIWKAYDTKLKRDVAIKIFSGRDIISARLKHRNIITIYDTKKIGDKNFIVIEFLKGVDLYETCKNSVLEWKEAFPIMVQMAKSIACVHKKGLIHCDIKPHNFIFSSSNRSCIKLTDFGICVKSKRDQNVTQHFGTPEFMPPEQKEGQVCPASDIYSLGLTYLYMLSGKVYTISESGGVPYIECVPTSFMKILTKMLENKFSNRYQNGKELLEDLKKFSPGTKTKSVSKLKIGLFAISFIILAFFIAFITQEKNQNSQELTLIFNTVSISNLATRTAKVFESMPVELQNKDEAKSIMKSIMKIAKTRKINSDDKKDIQNKLDVIIKLENKQFKHFIEMVKEFTYFCEKQK